jgi:HlyD family secretion protein
VAEAALQRAESNVDQARINQELHQAKYQRAQKLLPAQAISQDEFDIAEAEYLATAQSLNTARFEVEISRFELEMAEAAVKQFTEPLSSAAVEPFEIFAPISGRVLRVFEESTTVVAVGEPLLELGDPANLEIEIDVLSVDAVRIQTGADLLVEHWGGDAPLHANVRVIEPGAFTKISSLGVEEQRVNIIADFNEPPHRTAALGDGYRVEARITVDQLDDAILIPNSALFRHQREWHVMKIHQGRAELQRVSIGLQSESQTQIVDGLAAGDQTIVYPSDELVPGTPVRPVSP